MFGRAVIINYDLGKAAAGIIVAGNRLHLKKLGAAGRFVKQRAYGAEHGTAVGNGEILDIYCAFKVIGGGVEPIAKLGEFFFGNAQRLGIAIVKGQAVVKLLGGLLPHENPRRTLGHCRRIGIKRHGENRAKHKRYCLFHISLTPLLSLHIIYYIRGAVNAIFLLTLGGF